MTRQKKTPKQRAEEALAVAERKVAQLKTERDKAQSTLLNLEAELGDAVVRRDYLKQDPALPPTPKETPTA